MWWTLVAALALAHLGGVLSRRHPRSSSVIAGVFVCAVFATAVWGASHFREELPPVAILALPIIFCWLLAIATAGAGVVGGVVMLWRLRQAGWRNAAFLVAAILCFLPAIAAAVIVVAFG